MEYEVKLDLGDQAKYERLVASLGTPQFEIQQENYFFDTSEGHLLELHWALRVRTITKVGAEKSLDSTSAEITFKGPQEGDGELSARSEINAELPLATATAAIAGGFDLTVLKLEPIEAVRKLIGESKLIPLVSFRNRRIVFDMRPDCDFPLEIDMTTFGEGSVRYELEMEFPERIESDLAQATAYIKRLFESLDIPYLAQPMSKFAVALQKRSLLR